MQVQPQPHQEVVDENRASRSKSRSNPSSNQTAALTEQDDWSVEGLIFPQLIRKGVGQCCFYCLMKSGFSVNFTSLDQYGKYIIFNHEGYSPYVFDKDVRKYKKELKGLRKKQMDYPKQFKQPQ